MGVWPSYGCGATLVLQFDDIAGEADAIPPNLDDAFPFNMPSKLLRATDGCCGFTGPDGSPDGPPEGDSAWIVGGATPKGTSGGKGWHDALCAVEAEEAVGAGSADWC